MDSLARLPDRFTRWPSLRCADSVLRHALVVVKRHVLRQVAQVLARAAPLDAVRKIGAQLNVRGTVLLHKNKLEEAETIVHP